MKDLLNLLKDKPYLTWYIKDKEALSEDSILEHIYNYGNWDDYMTAENALGIKSVRSIYERLKSKHRVNIRVKTINYFDNYYQKYA